MSGLQNLASALGRLPGWIASLDPVYTAMLAIGVLLILAAIRSTSKLAVWLGLTVLLLVLMAPIQQPTQGSTP